MANVQGPRTHQQLTVVLAEQVRVIDALLELHDDVVEGDLLLRDLQRAVVLTRQMQVDKLIASDGIFER